MWDEKAVEIFGDELTDILDNNDIAIIDVSNGNWGKKYAVEMEWYSPAGEDVLIDIECDGKEDFAEAFREYAKDFDEQEHAEMWVEHRNGGNGVPKDINTLVEDAKAIKEHLVQVGCELSGEEYVRDEMTVQLTLNSEELLKLAAVLEIKVNKLDKEDVASALHDLISEVETEPELTVTEEEVIEWGKEQLSSLTYGSMKNEISSSSYDDVLSSETILSAFQKFQDSPDKKTMSFEDFLYQTIYEDWGWETEADCEEELLDKLRDKAEYESEEFQLTFNKMYEDCDSTYDFLEKLGFEGCEIDLHSFISDYTHINLMFATDTERNYERTNIISCFPSYDDVLMDEKYDKDGETSSRYLDKADNMLTYLVHQQGHTLTEVVESYYNEQYNKPVEDEKGFTETGNNSSFVSSVAAEVNETHGYMMYELTALVNLGGENLLQVLDSIAKGEGYITLSKETEIGLFNEWEGTGSALEIELEKTAVLPCNAIVNVQFEGGYHDSVKSNNGYTVDSVYGLIGSVWEQSKTSVTEEAPELPSAEQSKEDCLNAYNKIKDYAKEELEKTKAELEQSGKE